MAEHRQHLRIPIDRPLGIVQSTGEIALCRASGISQGGITATSPYAADVGQEFDLILDLTVDSRLQRLKLHGKVIYVSYDGTHEAFHLGMRFTRFYGEAEPLLKRFVDEHAGG